MEKNKKYVSKPNKKSAVALTFKIIALLLIIAAFTFCLVWTITNWDSVKNITNGANIATQEDVDKAFKDGYNQGIIDKENYTSQINDFKEKYENEKDKNSQLQKENADKEALLKKQYEEKIADTQKQLQEKMDNISILNSQLEAKDQSNAKLTEKVNELQNKITSLTNDNADKASTINQLKNQISDLKAELNSNLVDKNEFDATIEAYKQQIAELEASLKIYEDYYNQAQENQVIVTFKIGDQVYNLQTITKGNAPQAVTDPETNDHFVFNGWLLNGIRVNPTECTLNENTTFIADVTYKYDVNYYDETTVAKTEIIEAGQNATGHTIADTEGKIFEGWSLDGTTLVDPTTTTITANTNFYAVFTYKYKVTFMSSDNEVIDEQLIAAGSCATSPSYSFPKIYGKIAKGWADNGVLITVSSYEITHDTILKPLYKDAKIITEVTSSVMHQNSDLIMEGYSYYFREASYPSLISANLSLSFNGSMAVGGAIHIRTDNEEPSPNNIEVSLNNENNFEQTINYVGHFRDNQVNINFKFYKNSNGYIAFDVVSVSTSLSNNNLGMLKLIVKSGATITYYSNTEVAE